MSEPFYSIVTEGTQGRHGLLCRVCERVSWNPTDVTQRYCGRCQLFLERTPEQIEAFLETVGDEELSPHHIDRIVASLNAALREQEQEHQERER